MSEHDLHHDFDDFVTYRGEPFTGEGVETYSSGSVAALNTYVNGTRHGIQREWFRDGSLKADGRYQDGQPHGTYKRWHANGRLAIEIELSDSGYPAHRREWDPAGNLVADYPEGAGCPAQRSPTEG